MKRDITKQFQEFDSETKTPSDFAVECKIPEQLYKKFLEVKYPSRRLASEYQSGSNNPSVTSKKSIIQEMSKTLFHCENVKQSAMYLFKKFFIEEIELILKNE